jgi:hypothetical protein
MQERSSDRGMAHRLFLAADTGRRSRGGRSKRQPTSTNVRGTWVGYGLTVQCALGKGSIAPSSDCPQTPGTPRDGIDRDNRMDVEHTASDEAEAPPDTPPIPSLANQHLGARRSSPGGPQAARLAGPGTVLTSCRARLRPWAERRELPGGKPPYAD